MLSKKKKFIILGVMIALLVVSGYLNVVLNNRVVDTGTQLVTSGNFFSTYRDDRQAVRSQEIAYYDAILTSEASSQENKTLAETKKLELIAQMEKELVMEGLIKAKGFEDVVVTNSTNNINIVIKSGELQSTEVAQIVNVVQEQTGKSIDNIKIIPVE